MAGQYLIKKDVIQSIQEWLYHVSDNVDSWKGNNLHIDEIKTFEEIKRTEWFHSSLLVLKEMLLQNKNDALIFLHIDLKEMATELEIDEITTEWIELNIGEFTPPSFNFTTYDYFEEFYSKELVKIQNHHISESGEFIRDVDIFYRCYYDESEKLYSGELYFFEKSKVQKIKSNIKC